MALSYTESTDLYKAKYGLPLEAEGPERYLATKVPIRKNKDYRPKFRNFVMGYPIYKKDNYTRHFSNFLDILDDNHAPAIQYSKAFVYSSLFAAIPSLLYCYVYPTSSLLEKKRAMTTINYVYPEYLKSHKLTLRFVKKQAFLFGISYTSIMILRDFLK